MLSPIAFSMLLALSGTALATPSPRPLAAPVDAARAAGEALQLHMHPELKVPTLLQAHGEARTRGLARGAASDDAEALARAHLDAHRSLYRLEPEDIASLKLRESSTLRGGSRLLRFTQQVDGIEVFREQVTVLIGKDGGLDAISGYVPGAAGVRGGSAGAFRIDAEAALSRVLSSHGDDTSLQRVRRDGDWQYLGPRDAAGASVLAEPARTRPVFFRSAHGLVPAHYLEVMLAEGGSAVLYAYVVSAKTGELLYEHRLQEDAEFSYRVWGSTVPPYTPAPGPQGSSAFPHPTGVPDGFQPPFTAPSLVTLQSAPFSQNDPWLPDGATVTTGNNVDAYADLTAPDGYNAGDLRPGVTAPAVFDRTFLLDLDANANPEQIAAAATQLFYTVNWLHDEFYDAGFNEAAGNAQASNYGRGGMEGDRIRAEAQDYSGTNNANMATPSDGGSPRMQMYLYTGTDAAALTATGQVNGTFAAGTASFGPTTFDLTGSLAVADPLRACTALANPAGMVGRVVLVERGDCDFNVKVMLAQQAGAIGVVVADNVPGAATGMGGTNPSVAIPSLRVSQPDGQALLAGAGAGVVNVQLRRVAGVTRDGTIDNSIIAHEWGHYISNRLIGNANGLTTNQARGMGEGWGDFHSLLITVRPEHIHVPSNQNWDGTYAVGSYATGKVTMSGSLDNAAYHGIRRYPYSFRLDRNPLQFRHIDDSQPSPTSPPPSFGGTPNSQVHNTGEVWASMLWDCYVSLLRAHPFQEAYDRMKYTLVAGYKLTPVDPTFIEARDALLLAFLANDPADFQRCAVAFARRGAGAGAKAPPRDQPNNIGVVESHSNGPAVEAQYVEADDSLHSCDNDGVLDPGERGMLHVSLRNVGFNPSMGGLISVGSGWPVLFPGATDAPFGMVPLHGSTQAGVEIESRGGQEEVLEFQVESQGDGHTHTGSFPLLAGYDIVDSANERFEAMGQGWTVASEPGMPDSVDWRLAELSMTRHVAHADDRSGAGIGWLQSPSLQVGNDPLVFDIRHRFAFESSGGIHWDGGLIELSLDGGTTWVDLATFGFSGYNGAIVAGMGNPAGGRAALVGASAGFPDFEWMRIDLGTQFAGQNVMLRFGVATDLYEGDHGWDVDEVRVEGISGTPFRDRVPDQAMCHGFLKVSGDDQLTGTGLAFDQVLTVRVHAPDGMPQAGFQVQFTAPDSGAGASFEGGSRTVTVVTDGNGLASSPVLTANGTAGSFVVEARMGGQAVQFTLESEHRTIELFRDGFEN